jgi:hypothetical protein
MRTVFIWFARDRYTDFGVAELSVLGAVVVADCRRIEEFVESLI